MTTPKWRAGAGGQAPEQMRLRHFAHIPAGAAGKAGLGRSQVFFDTVIVGNLDE